MNSIAAPVGVKINQIIKIKKDKQIRKTYCYKTTRDVGSNYTSLI